MDLVTTQLLRFEERDLVAQSRQMQESLRSYVPSAVAKQLDDGQPVAAGEREVTVLFVDIRGYSTYAEGRDASEIFSTVNRYTERVSEVIQEHDGSVVEFNGDGMMAVFAALAPLADKEVAAVRAGRKIVAVTAELAKADANMPDLGVGVGISTGLAYVGSVRSADRWIWTAIGNTTNLAARYQALTRDIGAWIAIDEATHRGAGRAVADFELHEGVSIRGLRRAADVYALPMA